MMLDFVGMSGLISLARFRNSIVLQYFAFALTLGVRRSTVSILWFMISGFASISVFRLSNSPPISDGSTSIVVYGFSSLTRLTVSAYTFEPASFRSSLATAVMTTCFRFISLTDSATRFGSSQSSSFGRPVLTAQNLQARVQTAPRIMNVAVRLSAQHSWMFGHFASCIQYVNSFHASFS